MIKKPNKPFVISKLRSANGTPVLPPVGLRHAPTMQSGNIRDFNAEYKRRIEAVSRSIRGILSTMLKPFNNGVALNAKRYTYNVNPDLFSQIIDLMHDAIYADFMDDYRTYREGFWSDRYIRRAFDAGVRDAMQSAMSVTKASTAGEELARAVIEDSSLEMAYRQDRALRSGMVASRVFENMKGLTETMRDNLASSLSRGIERGAGVMEISKDIIEKVGTTGARATRIARTEINNAYRNANFAETRRLNSTVYKGTGFELRYLWFSALAETTRSWHAARHGEVYTVDEVVEFYETGANAINCYCSQTPVLYNKKTGEILQKDLANQMVEQRVKFKKAA